MVKKNTCAGGRRYQPYLMPRAPRPRCALLATVLAASLGAQTSNPSLQLGTTATLQMTQNSPVLGETILDDNRVVIRCIRLDFVPIETGFHTLLAKSHFYDVRLVVQLGDGTHVADDDDGWLNTHSRIVTRLTAGTRYSVLVAANEGTGACEVTVRFGKVAAVAERDRSLLEIEDLRERVAVHRAAGVDGTALLDPLEDLARRMIDAGMEGDAVPLFEEALRIRQAARAGETDLEEALLRNDLGLALQMIGRDEAVAMFESSLAMLTELSALADDPDVATVRINLAKCLMFSDPGRAVLHAEAGLAMQARICGGQPDENLLHAENILACCLDEAGRHREALPRHVATLVMHRNMRGDADHPELAELLSNLGACHADLGHPEEALAHHEQALQMRRRLSDGAPDLDTVCSMTHVAACLLELGRPAESQALDEEALATCKRLDGPEAAEVLFDCLNNLGSTHNELGRPDLALEALEEALKRCYQLPPRSRAEAEATCLDNLAQALLHSGRPDLALQRATQGLELCRSLGGDSAKLTYSLVNIALYEAENGRLEEALAYAVEALEMADRVFAGQDHPIVADCLMRQAACLELLGRAAEAQETFERALALLTRLHRGDHPAIAVCLNNLAHVLVDHGRLVEGLTHQEEARAMLERVYRRDHPEIVNLLHNIATSLRRLGQEAESLQRDREAEAMAQRLAKGGSPASLAASLQRSLAIKPLPEALEQIHRALALLGTIHGDVDHPSIARALETAAVLEYDAGHRDAADQLIARSFAMWQRIHGERDHEEMAQAMITKSLWSGGTPDLAISVKTLRRAAAMSLRLHPTGDHELNLQCHAALALVLGADKEHDEEAIHEGRLAIAVLDKLRAGLGARQETKQTYFDQLKNFDTHELLQMLLLRSGHAEAAFAIAEHARSRMLLDAVGRNGLDALEDARRHAEWRGDSHRARALADLAVAQRKALQDHDRLILRSAALARIPGDPAVLAERQKQLDSEMAELAAHRRHLREQEIGLLDAHSVGATPAGVPEVRAALDSGEVLLEYVLHERFGCVYLVDSQGSTSTFALPPFSEVATALEAAARSLGRADRPARGIDPDEPSGPAEAKPLHQLFTILMPPALWERLLASKRVFLAAHQQLHGLPFEALVTSMDGEAPSYWLDRGPAIAYVPSGSTLVWLRSRAAEKATTPLRSAMLVGNPTSGAPASPWPTSGAFVTSVKPDSAAARAGLQRGDMIVGVGSTTIANDQELTAALASHQSADGRLPLELRAWRAGQELHFRFEAGSDGLELAPGGGRAAVLAMRGTGCGALTRELDLALLSALPPLRGADDEAAAVASLWKEHGYASRLFRGAAADEASVREAAATADCLHFACHGVGVSLGSLGLSMLVLAAPSDPLADDDGLLRATDLLHDPAWREQRWQLVVLSACSTNVGASNRDDAPQALPAGFLMAGARSVVGTMWPVEDGATMDLMVDFHRRLLENDVDRLAALVASKRTLRSKQPSPRVWAPFVWHGLPR
jgi:tetratricopeptide (TPR) repeat protein